MPSLFDPVFPPLIRSLPVQHHSVKVERDFWHAKFGDADQAQLWAAIFGNNPVFRLSRCRLLNHAYATPAQKCAEILLWGYPRDLYGIASKLLPAQSLNALHTANAAASLTWSTYAANFPHGAGISTITKLAYFYGHRFGGQQALILDQRVIDNIQNWNELHEPLAELTYADAVCRYPDYLTVMHGVAQGLGCTPEQLEFFLFSLGDCF
jgi:hypothetical protein